MSFIDECLDTLGDCLDAAKDAVVDVVMDEDNQKIAAGVLGGGLLVTGIAAYTMSEAQEVKDEGEGILEAAQKKYNKVRNKTQAVVEALNKKKIAISSGSIAGFVNLLSQIQNVYYANDVKFEDLRSLVPYSDCLLQWDESNDTNINYWLAAIPIVGPLAMYCDADEALSKAKTFREQAKQCATRLEQECSLWEARALRAGQIINLLTKADNLLSQENWKISYILSIKGCDWDKFSSKEHNCITNMINMVLTMEIIIGTSLLYEDGVSVEKLQEQLYKYAM